MNGIRVYDGPRRTDWNTPPEIYDALNAEFGFTYDPCPRLGDGWRVDGLSSSWRDERVFLNPPYRDIAPWIRKAYQETREGSTLVVGLVPVRTDTRWWHHYVMRAGEVRLSLDRIWFERSDGERARAPFGSAVVVWQAGSTYPPCFTTWLLPDRAGKAGSA